MKVRTCLTIVLALFAVSAIISGCNPPTAAESCVFTANEPLTAYRLPDSASDVFGVIPVGDSFDILAQTADGWVGFDPGVAQAGYIGLAHHKWVLLNATISPSCLSSVELVTLADVQADLAASGQ
jgi:hypothetical protein